jgi:hypothetical protein
MMLMIDATQSDSTYVRHTTQANKLLLLLL